MRTVAMRTAITLKSMLPPMEREISSAACARSGGPRLGNFEGAAIDRSDVEDLAGLARGEILYITSVDGSTPKHSKAQQHPRLTSLHPIIPITPFSFNKN